MTKKQEVKKKRVEKNTKGITLISLVITIIILIILAGIAINLTVGENGLVSKAKQAKENYKVAELKETLQLKVLESQTNDNLFDYNELKKSLKNIGIIISDEEKYPISIKLENYNFKIDSEGNVVQVCSAIQVANNPEEYYGKYITNYATTDDTETVNWKIFYSDRNNIYIIADDYIPYENIPYSTKNGNKTLNKPLKGNYERSASFDNILMDYKGTANIDKYELKLLNKNYFLENKYSSENDNIKVLAYMMDTDAWKTFQTDKAEYAIGGPTIEMLCNSYNQLHNNGENRYQAIANTNGYRISNDYGKNFAEYIYTMLDTTDNLYVIDNSKSKAWAYNLASPSNYAIAQYNCRVSYNGDVLISSYSDKRKSVLDH